MTVSAPLLNPEMLCPQCNQDTLQRKDVASMYAVGVMHQSECICGYVAVQPLLCAQVMLRSKDEHGEKYICDFMDSDCGLVRLVNQKTGKVTYHEEDQANDLFWPEGFSIRATVGIDAKDGMHFGLSHGRLNASAQRMSMPSGVPDGMKWFVFLQMLAQVAQVAVLQSGFGFDE